MSIEEIKSIIREAFKGVTLDGGISMKQADIGDNYGKDRLGREIAREEYNKIPASEITQDWQLLTLDYLEEYAQLAHADVKSFRYYIPAFMLSVFISYSCIYSHVCATLHSLNPKKDRLWDYYMMHYSLLNANQRRAIAIYLKELPGLVDLDPPDIIRTQEAISTFWKDYLPAK